MNFKSVKIIFLVAMSFIVLRLFYWQVVMADDLTARAENQRLTERDIEAERGTILYSDNSVLAATQPAYLLFAQPALINQKKGPEISSINAYKKNFSEKLAQVLIEEELKHKPDLDQNEATKTAEQKEQELKVTATNLQKNIYSSLTKDLYWVSLGKKIDSKLKDKLESLNLVGLGFEQTSARFYPEGSASAQLLGFVGSDVYGGETGYFGLEGFYNGELKGKKGLVTEEKDALGLPILIGKFSNKQPKSGKTLVLNIDRTIQMVVEEKIKKGVEKYKAKGGSVVVMEPETGNILAMASYPSYDPSYPSFYTTEDYRNPITADSYEPGSTFKVLVMAAGLNEDLVEPDTVCDNCSGPLELGGFTIRTWNNKYQEKLTMTDAIIHSDNTGMVFVGKKMGADKMYEYLTNFGFGDNTGIDLQDESSPALREKGTWKEIDLATSSFGQGIPVTAIQIVRAVGAIANGGKLMEPHIVSEIREEGKTFKVHPRVVSEPIKIEAALDVKEMMIKAVDLGEAQYYKKAMGIKDFKIAGKTGTAQIPVAGHYDPNKTIASFVGFAPADNPKFVMLVRYDRPTSSIYGADTAAPTFFEIAKEIFTYLNIAPDNI